MRSLQAIILCFLPAFLSITTASSWEDSNQQNGVIRRRDISGTLPSVPPSTKGSDLPATTSSDASGSITAAPSTTGGDLSGTSTATGSNTGSSSGSGSGSNAGSNSGSKTSKKSTPTLVDPRLPPGGIEMVTPSPNSLPTYIKIGEPVTFKWNYTSLIVSPTAIDVVAYCSRNHEYYTIASNQTFSSTGEVTWDTGETATVPLLTESYTFMVYDTVLGPTGVPSAGHLGNSGQYIFGMYHRQSYTPLNAFTCATCSGTMSSIERQALGFVFGMVAITVLSFTWFANGFGVFS